MWKLPQFRSLLTRIPPVRFHPTVNLTTSHGCHGIFSKLTPSTPPTTVEIENEPTTLEVTNSAEKLLGPERFSLKEMSLSSNFGRFQEIITLFLLKVSDIDHPLLELTKIIEAEHKFRTNESQVEINPYPCWRRMIVLLVTEMFGYPLEMKWDAEDKFNFMLERHDRVGQIAEISAISQILHNKILDMKDCVNGGQFKKNIEKQKYLEEMHTANKAAILIGDLLLSQKCVHMAALRDPVATEVICSTLSDYCEGCFSMDIGTVEDEKTREYSPWLRKTRLELATLLGNMIYLNLYFSGCDQDSKSIGMRLGNYLGIMLQARSDIEFFQRGKLENPSWLNLSLLPVVLKLHKDPSLLQKEHVEIFERVKQDPEVMQKALDVFKEYQNESLRFMEELQVKSVRPRYILMDFVRSLTPSI